MSVELNVRGRALRGGTSGGAGLPAAAAETPGFSRSRAAVHADLTVSGSCCSVPGRTLSTSRLLSAGTLVLGRPAGFPGCRLWNVSSKNHGREEAVMFKSLSTARPEAEAALTKIVSSIAL